MKRLILAAILFLFPFSAQAGFPEGEKGYDLKKIEESFRLPCDEIGNDDCIARALGVGACTWVFGINMFIPNTQVQAPTPNALAIQSSFPISSQGNLKDSSIFFRS